MQKASTVLKDIFRNRDHKLFLLEKLSVDRKCDLSSSGRISFRTNDHIPAAIVKLSRVMTAIKCCSKVYLVTNFR